MMSKRSPMFCSDSDQIDQRLQNDNERDNSGVGSGQYIQIEINHQNHFSRSEIPEDIMECLRRNPNVEHIRIISTENYGKKIADQRKESDESNFLINFKTILNYLLNLRTLYLETFAFASINYFPSDPLPLSSRMEKVIVVNRRHLNPGNSVNVYVKQVSRNKRVDFHGINVEKHIWAGVISKGMGNWKNMEELCVEIYSQLSYVMSVSFAPNSLKSLNLSGVFISCDDFKHVCLNCPKLETLVICIQEIMPMRTFSNVINLKNLSYLDMRIIYYFTRELLAGVFLNSEFSKLFVIITEYKNTGSSDTLLLKDGLITIHFNGGRFGGKIVNPHSID